ncbi:MAG: phosphoribosylanthranilate isomerase [Ruminococcus sp.]|nr:phosphoribosylanthranilate isomerase [Ruminococcus sp.]
MTKIKLCGMMRPSDVTTAVSLGADYVGFVLTEGFRRSVGAGELHMMLDCIADSAVKRVGVFVDEPIENIIKNYADMLDMIQLHGSEDESYIRDLKELAGKPVIKSFTVVSNTDIEAAEQCCADLVLLDSGKGTGRVFDHSLIKGISRPYFLAGGLNAENVGEAIASLHPFAVDASSGIETEGFKDKTKMTAFVNAVRKG